MIYMARAMLRGIGRDLSPPARHPRLRLIDIPEICLIAAIVVAVKHFLPFPSGKGNSLVLHDTILPRVDWQKWSELMQPVVEDLRGETPEDIPCAPKDIDGGHLADADEATFDAILNLLSSDQGEHGEDGEWSCAPFEMFFLTC